LSSDPYQALPSFPAGAPLRFNQEPAVQLIAAGPARQRRLTVAFRLILAIPHIFALLCLNLGGFVLAFAGWWAALFIGRLPGFAVSYLSGLARWNARVLGYLLLLTDVYPPFTVDDAPGYPVVIAIPERERLNRFAVFFRGTLAIWANIVANAVGGGAAIVAFVAWLITLVTGKLPAPLHLAFTAVLRYQTRYYCYLGLLTPTYPWKLFGDEPDASAGATAAPAETAPAETAPPAETTETAAPVESAWGTPPGYDTATPGYGAQRGYGTPESVYGTPGGYGWAQPASPSADWPLVLPRSAKILLSLFIALGLILNGASNYVSLKSRERANHAVNAQALAISQWNSAGNTLNAKMAAWSTSANACGNTLTCNTAAAARAASYMSAFASQVHGIAMPTAATSAAAAKLVVDATRASADFTTVSQDTTVAQFQADMASSGLSPDMDDVQADIGRLANAFNNP
jgi:hypothetical protein